MIAPTPALCLALNRKIGTLQVPLSLRTLIVVRLLLVLAEEDIRIHHVDLGHERLSCWIEFSLGAAGTEKQLP